MSYDAATATAAASTTATSTATATATAAATSTLGRSSRALDRTALTVVVPMVPSLPVTDPAPTPAPASPAARPAPAAPSPDGIGDIVSAGEASPYPHLRTRPAPTVGRLVSAARAAADALERHALWPQRHGRWQPGPRPARRGATGPMRVTSLVLAPGAAADLPARGARHGSALRIARGRVRVEAPGGRAAASAPARDLESGRTRVLGSTGRYRVVNTGSEPALLVRVSGR
ncbi:hypothetical protein LG943_04395 [Streptomonospora sp. S1-112]|uniref:Uncharacterized protein n=1 Tax=Streptomonospora mangrovi TaxID=2883123 RepID=A0A9X3NKN9_9ACTN|nr:hypothetical protein [Streptomonospora mangrovi]MDA0563574.1 hypothetical protein [Streptomonospora mangrovi]